MSNSAVCCDALIETNTRFGVTVVRRPVDDQFQDDLAVRTLEALLARLGSKGNELGTGMDPTETLSLLTVALRILHLQEQLGTTYVNPMFVVTAANDSSEFYRQVRICRLVWLNWLQSFIGRRALRQMQRLDNLVFPGMSNRMQKLARVLMRELRFTGVLIIRGKHKPKETPRANRDSNQLVGKVFERLTVTKVLSRGRCYCTCSCGKAKVARITHLSNGHVKSCGCLRGEMDEAMRQRKAERALRYTGGLTVVLEMEAKELKAKQRAETTDKRRRRRAQRASRKVGPTDIFGDQKNRSDQPSLRSGSTKCVLLPMQRAPETDSTGRACRSGGAQDTARESEGKIFIRRESDLIEVRACTESKQNHPEPELRTSAKIEEFDMEGHAGTVRATHLKGQKPGPP